MSRDSNDVTPTGRGDDARTCGPLGPYTFVRSCARTRPAEFPSEVTKIWRYKERLLP